MKTIIIPISDDHRYKITLFEKEVHIIKENIKYGIWYSNILDNGMYFPLSDFNEVIKVCNTLCNGLSLL